MKWSDSQRDVIDFRGNSLLVSAAAGSGKTAVLVERIVARILDENHPLDIDHLLVVTFTNAAASQLKQRIIDNIEKKLDDEEHPLEDKKRDRLTRQLSLVNNAQISTIHSFCLSLIRNYFLELGIDPGFRMADETELTLWKADVLSKLLENAYEHVEEDEEFRYLVESIAHGRTDDALGEILLRIYQLGQSEPFPEQWFQDSWSRMDAILMAAERGEENQESKPQELFDVWKDEKWMQFLLKDTFFQVKEWKVQLENLAELCEVDSRLESDQETLKSDIDMFDRILAEEENDYVAISNRINESGFGKLKATPRKKKDDDEEKYEVMKNCHGQIKDCRDEIKKGFEKLRSGYYPKDLSKVNEHLMIGARLTKQLLKMGLEFTRMFMEEKAERKVLDFGDLEHYALLLLWNQEEEKPSEVAQELSEYFDEIMIDEYQDSNQVQEFILTAIAKRDSEKPQEYPYTNVFMVGDVKQSIYKFRNAKPEMFMQKEKSFHTNLKESEKKAPGCLIRLSTNFRSRVQVIDSVNDLFHVIMQGRIGGIDYNEEARLNLYIAEKEEEKVPSPRCLEDVETELLLVEPEEEIANLASEIENENTKKEEERKQTNQELEARMVARRIKRLITEGQMVVKEKQKDEQPSLRPVEYGDIVILLRTMRGWSEEFMKVLAEEGIPVCSDTKTGYFQTMEIQFLINLLRVIDNPRQDLALTAVLTSPIYELTHEQLALLRIYNKKGCLYDSMSTFLQRMAGPAVGNAQLDTLNEELQLFAILKKFTRVLEEYRRYSSCHSVEELLEYILTTTDFISLVRALPAGERRVENIYQLERHAKKYGESHYSGLYHFVQYMERLFKYEIDFGEADAPGSKENCVHIMSIHKSKGLEFPIVFVSGLAKQFNQMDLHEWLISDTEYGLSMEWIDPKRRLRGTTIAREAMRQHLKLDMIGEELRVLYVAMTRAKEKLILTAFGEEREKVEKKLSENARQGQASYLSLLHAKSYYDLVLSGAKNMKLYWKKISDLRMTLAVNQLSQREKFEHIFRVSQSEEKVEPVNEKLAGVPEGNESFKYPYLTDTTLRGKVTVTELKKREHEQLFSEKLLEQELFVGQDLEIGDMKQLLSTESVSKQQNLGQVGTEHQDTVNIAPTDIEHHETVDVVPETLEIPLPDFLKEEEMVTGAHRGTVYHKLMECLPLDRIYKKEELADELARMESEGLITKSERAAVSVSEIHKFFSKKNEGVTKRLIEAAKSNRLFREQPFVMGEPAEKLSITESKTIVLIQGIIDAYFEDQGEWVLLDYKTDHVKKQDGEEVLRKRYRKQLALYAQAISKGTKKPVKEAYLYSFALGKYVEVPLEGYGNY